MFSDDDVVFEPVTTAASICQSSTCCYSDCTDGAEVQKQGKIGRERAIALIRIVECGMWNVRLLRVIHKFINNEAGITRDYFGSSSAGTQKNIYRHGVILY